MRLEDLTWTELSSAVPPVLVVPVGSCEQHGPHLPLGTDTFIAEAIADRLAQRCPTAAIAPSIAVSASGEHAGFAGTLSIGSDATTTLLVELARSADWSAGVLVVNGHGGNRRAVAEAVDIARAEGRRVEAWWPRIAGGDAHAGRTETSLMLAIRPDLVRLEAAAPGAVAALPELMGRLRTGGVGAVSANGVLGDPAGASADEGRAILAALADDAVRELVALLPPEMPLDRGRPALA